MNPIVEVRNVDLQVTLIFVPGYPVDSNGRCLLQVEEGFGQTIFVDVMQQGGEFERAVLAGGFTHAKQSARLAFDPARCPVQDSLLGVSLG